MPPLAFDLAGRINAVVREAVLAAPSTVEHIFTNWLADTDQDAAYLEVVRALASVSWSHLCTRLVEL